MVKYDNHIKTTSSLFRHALNKGHWYTIKDQRKLVPVIHPEQRRKIIGFYDTTPKAITPNGSLPRTPLPRMDNILRHILVRELGDNCTIPFEYFTSLAQKCIFQILEDKKAATVLDKTFATFSIFHTHLLSNTILRVMDSNSFQSIKGLFY